MNNRQLDKLLRSAQVPGRSPQYWEAFPKRLAAKAAWAKPASEEGSAAYRPRKAPLWFFGLGLATACVVLGFVLGLWQGHRPDDFGGAVAEARHFFQEIEPLFPGQLRSIVFDRQGPRLVLSEKPDVPASPPVFVQISGPKGIENFVTFSGQQIRVNGDVFEVLLGGGGEVLLVGRDTVWSSARAELQSGAYRIEAETLGGAS